MNRVAPSAFLGVDPGAGGALALYDPATGAAELYDMPTHRIVRGRTAKTEVDGYSLGILIDSLKARIARAVVEQVSGRPGQGGQFAFGLNCGILHGCLYANLIPLDFVASNRWKPAMGIRRAATQTKADMKDEARRRASMMFPHLAGEFARKKDDGRSEALLIAVYGSKAS